MKWNTNEKAYPAITNLLGKKKNQDNYVSFHNTSILNLHLIQNVETAQKKNNQVLRTMEEEKAT